LPPIRNPNSKELGFFFTKNKKKLLLIFLCLPFFSLSQHNHDDHYHDLNTHDNEFALGIGFIPKHENAIGIHSHYTKGVGLNNKLGAGISF